MSPDITLLKSLSHHPMANELKHVVVLSSDMLCGPDDIQIYVMYWWNWLLILYYVASSIS